ncbi:hypothetical protein AYO44_03605 [Planctomycetaceae bacterium SCGC AG-212-F19]|nr:hypothetical protein AYO44_03605 [Planctomycetaceae bacterium SCGC AG-212-F19]
MQTSFPLISAVIPVFNGERYLEEAIRSILAQQYQPLELIVVDDGSTDGTRELVQRFSTVRCDHRPHAGIGATRNRGLELAQGELIAFLDADDVWTPEKLVFQWSAFRAQPDLDIVTGHVEQFHSSELDATITRHIDCPKQSVAGYAFGAMLIKRRAFDTVGLISEELERAEGIDWCLRARELGHRIKVLSDVVMRRRLHETNHSRTHRQALANYAQVLKASLDRRRAGTGGPMPRA